jgi:hypothetical protein
MKSADREFPPAQNLHSNFGPASKGTIVVWGLLANYPHGGFVWQVLHNLVSLRRLGFDVWYVTDMDRPAWRADDTGTFIRSYDFAPTVDFMARQFESAGLGGKWVFRIPKTSDEITGTPSVILSDLYTRADAVINLHGAQFLGPRHDEIRCLIYLQTDPIRHEVEVAMGNQSRIQYMDRHQYYFNYGENLGAPDCGVPMIPYKMHPTRAPICVDWWESTANEKPKLQLTTIASFAEHPRKSLRWQGETYYWDKHRAWKKFKGLPSRSQVSYELALTGLSQEHENEIRANGWKVCSGTDLAAPDAYRGYIQQSAGEFSVAKDQVVRLRSGWFSDRSACYLAAGRPVVLEDTGFGNILPTGRGLFAVRTEDDAAAAVDAIASDYQTHSRAAREIAKEYFDGEKVLGRVMRTIGLL